MFVSTPSRTISKALIEVFRAYESVEFITFKYSLSLLQPIYFELIRRWTECCFKLHKVNLVETSINAMTNISRGVLQLMVTDTNVCNSINKIINSFVIS